MKYLMEKELAPPFHTNYLVMVGNEGERGMIMVGLAEEVLLL